MIARQLIAEASAAGIRLTAEGEKLVAEWKGEVSPEVLDRLKRHKPEILAELCNKNPRPPDAPLWWPRPHPEIRCEPPFGADDVPDRYQAAWQALLAQCPPGVPPFVWEAAIYDATTLFGDFGRLIDDYRWPPGSLFDVPRGLVWFIKGNPVVAIGRTMAQCQDGRLWRRASL